MENDFKIVVDCPLCDEHELQVVKDDTKELMQCISCGYSTSDILAGDINTNEVFNNMDSSIKKWAKEVNDQIWIPSVLNLEAGILYPTESDDKSMKWAFAPLVDIDEKEQKNYPNPSGGFFEKRYDIEKEVLFDSFAQGITEINMVISARKEMEESVKKPKK